MVVEVGRGSSTAHPSKLSPRVVPAHFPGFSKDLAFNAIELKKYWSVILTLRSYCAYNAMKSPEKNKISRRIPRKQLQNCRQEIIIPAGCYEHHQLTTNTMPSYSSKPFETLRNRFICGRKTKWEIKLSFPHFLPPTPMWFYYSCPFNNRILILHLFLSIWLLENASPERLKL